MRFGVFSSLVLHVAIVAAAFVSLPVGWRPPVAPEPYVPVELIREADLDLKTSVPAARPEPEPVEEPEPDLPEAEPEPEPAPEIEEIPEPEPAPVEPEPEPEPVEPEPEIVEPEPEPAPEPTPAPENVRPPKPADEDLDLDALSALIDKSKDDDPVTAPRETPGETAQTARAAIGAGDRLTASDEAKMRAAVERCWQIGTIIGAPDAQSLVVEIQFELNRDGTLASPPRAVNALRINLSGNRFWKVAEQQALRAVAACAPYDFLPQERYETWKEFQFNFIPPV